MKKESLDYLSKLEECIDTAQRTIGECEISINENFRKLYSNIKILAKDSDKELFKRLSHIVPPDIYDNEKHKDNAEWLLLNFMNEAESLLDPNLTNFLIGFNKYFRVDSYIAKYSGGNLVKLTKYIDKELSCG